MEEKNEIKEETEQLSVKKVFNLSAIKKGIFYFIIISLISLTGIYLYTNTGNTLKIWSQINFGFLLLSFGFTVVDLLIGGWRNHIFAREFVPTISQWVCFKANLANIFMGSITPSQTGGGPAQWYILYKNGLTIPELVSISVINFISTMIFFPVSGYLAYLVLSDNMDQAIVVHIVEVCFYVFAVISSLFFISLFFPKAIGRVIDYLSKWIGKIKNDWGEKVKKLGIKGEKIMIEYQQKSFDLLKRKPQLLLYSFVMTVVMYLNKYALAYFLVLALGTEVDFLVVISIMAIVYFLSYFAPSPGASGIAEISIASLMASVIASDYVGTFTVLYRSTLIFIPAIIGAYVVIRQLNLETKS